MAYDHEEQEQLDAIKAWWKQYGNLITWFLIILLSLFVVWKAWGVYKVKQASQASVLFEEVKKAIHEKDQIKVLHAVTDVQEKFSGTNYAQMASLLGAKSAFESGDLKTAKMQLVWVTEHGKAIEFKSLAKIRLAGILLDEKSYDDAQKLLEGNFPEALRSSIADRKGDILVAQNKIDEARVAYQSAISKGGPNNPERQYIQLKLDAIGGSSLVPGNKTDISDNRVALEAAVK
jgi:predicted negative regulator of RcsB-dependent stress response